DLEALGNFSANATFDWFLDNSSTPSLGGRGPVPLGWTVAGPHQVTLVVNEGQCSSQPLQRDILVTDTLPAPAVDCEAGVDQILFSWDPIPGAQDYLVNILQGPAGNRTSDTSILF